VSDLSTFNFDTMTAAEFEEHLPELFASADGKVSTDPRVANFLAANPDAAGLVSDLEAIAEAARSLFEPEAETEPSDSVWSNIASKLASDPNPDPSEA
jgi:hypothetical protein